MPPMMEIITAEQLMEYLGKAVAQLTQWQIHLTVLMKWREEKKNYTILCLAGFADTDLNVAYESIC